MADEFNAEASETSSSVLDLSMDATFFCETFSRSLNACDEFMLDLYKHVDLLYGHAMVDRLKALGLHQSDRHLIGMLVQLGDNHLCSPLDGYCYLRLLNVDFLSLLSCTELNCDGFLNLSETSDTEDLGDELGSIRFLYGVDAECDFRNLVAVLVRMGSSLSDSIRDVLSNKYGWFYEWRKTVVRLESTFTINRLPRSDIWPTE